MRLGALLAIPTTALAADLPDAPKENRLEPRYHLELAALEGHRALGKSKLGAARGLAEACIRDIGFPMKKLLFAIAVAATLLPACKSDNEKCKDICDDVGAEEHNGDAEWIKSCKDLCDKAAK